MDKTEILEKENVCTTKEVLTFKKMVTMDYICFRCAVSILTCFNEECATTFISSDGASLNIQ